MGIEDSGMIYYIDKNGKIQDGNAWFYDVKHDIITIEDLNDLKECYWSNISQRWITETN